MALFEADSSADIQDNLQILHQTGQEPQLIPHVALIHLPAREHQEDRLGNTCPPALPHTASTNVADSPRDELTARHTL